MTKFRKLILVLFFIGFAGNVGGGAGTFASFNASTTNPGSTFSSGSIVLSNQNNDTAVTCFSNGSGPSGAGANTDNNHNEQCNALFNTTLAKPGSVATIDLNLKNEGTLDGTLHLSIASHDPGTGAQTACSNIQLPGATYFGSGWSGGSVGNGVGFCEKLRIRIQRYGTSSRTGAVYSGVTGGCVYGFANPANNCSDAVGAGGSADGAEDFNLKHFTELSSAASGSIALGTLVAANTANACNVASGPCHTAWLRITIEFPDGGNADNFYQSRRAGFAVKWQLEQLPA